MNRRDNPEIGSFRAWYIWMLAALVFFYAFIQRVAPGVMVNDLMAEFAVGAAVVGTLSALYFYPYVLLQIPLGALMDRIGPRKLLTFSLMIAGLGSLLFAYAETIAIAYIGRTLIGIGSAVGFLGSLTLAANWFPPYRFAYLSGLVMFFGMSGGILGQGPLAWFIEKNEWRDAMLVIGIAGVVLGLIIYTFVRNQPESAEVTDASVKPWSDVWVGLKNAFSSSQVWKIAIVAATMSGPMLTLGALWGTPYLMAAYELPRAQAASYVSLLLLGWAFGAPFSGWLSDRIRKRKILLVTGSAGLTMLLAILCFVPNLPLLVVVSLFVGLGAFGAFMTVCFALARENSPAEISGSVTGIVNSLTVSSGALLQPAVGFVLDQLWDGKLLNGVQMNSASDFQISFLVVLGSCVIGFLIALTINESRLYTKV